MAPILAKRKFCFVLKGKKIGEEVIFLLSFVVERYHWIFLMQLPQTPSLCVAVVSFQRIALSVLRTRVSLESLHSRNDWWWLPCWASHISSSGVILSCPSCRALVHTLPSSYFCSCSLYFSPLSVKCSPVANRQGARGRMVVTYELSDFTNLQAWVPTYDSRWMELEQGEK